MDSVGMEQLNPASEHSIMLVLASALTAYILVQIGKRLGKLTR